MREVRGVVFICPSRPVPEGELLDPVRGSFWVSWQDDDAEGLVDYTHLAGAEAAIAWGRERATVVCIRLGNTLDSYFSAGTVRCDGVDPIWPPTATPPDGWWRPPEGWWPPPSPD